MSFSNYLNDADHALGARRALQRASSVLGAVANPTPAAAAPQKNVFSRFMADVNAARQDDVEDGIMTVAGAGAGYYYGKKHKHPVLGVIAGASLGRNITSMAGSDRNVAVRNLLGTGAGIAGALYVRQKPLYQIGAFVVGKVVAGYLASNVLGFK